MCFRLYLVVGQIHYLLIYYYTEHLFTCQELFRKRKDGVGFSRHHRKLFITYPSQMLIMTIILYIIIQTQKPVCGSNNFNLTNSNLSN